MLVRVPHLIVTERLIRKLSRFAPLSSEEKNALENSVTAVRRFSPNEDLIQQGAPSGDVNLILEGFACRYKMLRDGRRQIVGFLVPGDACDARIVLLRHMDHSIGALGQIQAALISRHAMSDLLDRFPKIMRALWWTTLVEESTTREWVVNVGTRTAFERVGHLFCELFLRLQAVGLTNGTTFDLPLTQHEIGETVALSTVHVNRTLMELRRAGLVTFQNHQLMIHDFAALQAASGFDEEYLHLDGQKDAGPEMPAHALPP